MRRLAFVLLCALLCCVLVFAATPVDAQTEETHLEVQLEEDGDARWTITAVVTLEDNDAIERFEAFGEEFEAGERGVDFGVDTFERAASEASDATGREMSIGSTEREAVVVRETDPDAEHAGYGELRVSFTWSSFARIDDNGTMYVDDAFNTTDGTWLPGLESGQTLAIHTPPGYQSPSTAPVGAVDGTLWWEGPETFEPGYFEIVYQPSAGVGAPSDTGLSTILLVGALVLSGAALLLGVYLLVRRRESGKPEPESPAASSASGTPENGVEGDDSAHGASVAATNGDGGDDTQPDLELLSDEERVEYLLEHNGGRMKQANIVKETGWSNAKVSQLLSSMDEDERINKLRIGRENLISLPDDDLTEFDEE